MDIANLSKAADLARKVGSMEETVAAYRAAKWMLIYIKEIKNPGRPWEFSQVHHTDVTAAEIGDAVVEVLQRRLDAMRAELRALGVTVGDAGDAGLR
jgi:hypothetical protein